MNATKVQGSTSSTFNICDFLTPHNASNTLIFCRINGVLGGFIEQKRSDLPYSFPILSFTLPAGTTTQSTNNAAATVLPLLKNISSLNMSNLEMTNDDLTTFLEMEPYPETVTELNLYAYRNTLTDNDLAEIAKLCSNLTSIDLSSCTLITRKGILKLFLRCLDLTSISLASAFSHDINPLIETMARFKPAQLRSIDLSECPTVTDASIQLLTKNCPQLTSIKLGGHHRIKDESIEALAKNKKLTSIDLRSCFSLTDAAIESIASHCPDLEKIDLSYCRELTDKALLALAKGCPKLTSIHLVDCRKITTQGVQAIAANKNLTFIDLSSCNQITNPAIESLAQCTGLVTTILYGCNQITENAFIRVIQNCPDLSIVHLGGSYFITDQTVEALAKNCHELHELRLKPLSGVNASISERALISLIENSPKLEVFVPPIDDPIGNASLLAFSRCCPNLREITLNNSIEEEAFEELMKGCPMLNNVEFARGTKVLSYTIREFLEISSSIRRIVYNGFSASELVEVKRKYPQVNFQLQT